MVFNEIYKEYAWKSFSDQYVNNTKELFGGLTKILRSHQKIMLNPNGSIMIDINNGTPIFLYSGEFFALLQACTTILTDSDVIAFEHGKNALIKQFENTTASLKYGEVGLAEATFKNRVNDYVSAVTSDYVLTEFSVVNASSSAEKIAEAFSDFVLASEQINDFCAYDLVAYNVREYYNSRVHDIRKFQDARSFKIGLYKYAVAVYEEVQDQIEPYLDGSIVRARKAVGVCPNCGGSFKGLLKKKCEICGTPKEK